MQDFHCNPNTSLARGPQKMPASSKQRSCSSSTAPSSAGIWSRLITGFRPEPSAAGVRSIDLLDRLRPLWSCGGFPFFAGVVATVVEFVKLYHSRA